MIEIKVLNKEFYGNDDATTLPAYATEGSAGMDLRCTADFTIRPGEVVMIPTGIAIHIGMAAAGLILPRSGLGRRGLVLANTMGLIDSDYQGELFVAAYNRTFAFPEIFELKAGDRFAQLMFVPFIKVQWEIVDEFSDYTKRGAGGFGSTN